MRIILICKDMGGYIGKLAAFLQTQGHEVLMLDTTRSSPPLEVLPGKLRSVARRHLGNWLDEAKIRKFGRSDVLLVVNPGQSEPQVIKAAMKVASIKKAYLYDSLARCPMPAGSFTEFDQIYSFDHTDVAALGLTKLYNFMYEPEEARRPAAPYKHKAFVVMSGEDRLQLLDKIALQLEQANYPNYSFRVQTRKKPAPDSKIIHTRERISLDDMKAQIQDAEILVDLIRPQQSGLSFRFFEAMQHQRKVITDNTSVLAYDFYHPHNILVIDNQDPQIPAAFLNTPYTPLPREVFDKYSLAGWCSTVFAPVAKR